MPNITHKPLPDFGGKTIAELWREGGMGNPEFIEASKQLLHQQRKLATTYETRLKNGDERIESFMGASIIRTLDNHFFISANQHNRKQPDHNQCAELNAKTEADNDPDVTDSRIGDLMFLGGKATVRNGEVVENIKESHYGARHTPCGACRDMIIDFSDPNAPARVHIYPLLRRDEELTAYDDTLDGTNLPGNMIRTYENPHHLRPYSDYPLTGQLQDFKSGLAELKRPPSGTKPFRGASDNGRVNGLTSNEKPIDLKTGRRPDFDRADFAKRVYDVMFQTLRREVHQPSRKALSLDTLDEHVVTIAVARTNQGEYFIGSYFEGAEKQSMPGAVMNAIQNSRFGGGITDVFFLPVDFTGLMEQVRQGRNVVTLPMPDGHTLQGIYKARKNASYSQLKPQDFEHMRRCISPFQDRGGEPRIHLFSLVSPKDFKISQHMHSMSIQELMPDIWLNPKSDPGKFVQPPDQVEVLQGHHKAR